VLLLQAISIRRLV